MPHRLLEQRPLEHRPLEHRLLVVHQLAYKKPATGLVARKLASCYSCGADPLIKILGI